MAEDLPEHAVETEFELVRRGYDQQQVDGHLRRLDAEIRILMADRAAAVDQAAQLGRELDESRARADRLRAQVRSLVHAPQTVQGMSERVRSMLRMAQDEVADMLANSEAEVVRRRQETDRYLAELIATAHANADAIGAAARVEAERSAAADAQARAQTERECDAARAELVAERAESERQIAEAVEQARGERGRDWSEAETRRALIEEDFAIAMDQRRSEAHAELAAGRAETKRREALILTTAAHQSRAMMADADRTVTEADRTAKAMIADAERTAKETVTDADRTAKAMTAHAERTAEETVTHADRKAEETVTDADRTAKETVVHADRTAKGMVAEAQHRVEDLIAVRALVAEQLRNGRGVMDVALSGLEAETAGEPAALEAARAHNSRAQPGAMTNGTAADRNAHGVEGESSKASSAPSPRPRTTNQFGVLIR